MKLLKKQIKFACVISPALMLLSGCFALSKHSNVRQAEGQNAGEVVIFTDVNSNMETATIFANDKFIAALPEQYQVSHKFCAGSYELKAKSVRVQPVTASKIKHITGKHYLTVEPGTVSFLSLNRTSDGWMFTPSKVVPEGLKYSDPNLLRRVSDEMIHCNY